MSNALEIKMTELDSLTLTLSCGSVVDMDPSRPRPALKRELVGLVQNVRSL